ncbi:hypothetical protein SLEP1_g32748 [Rubroshorea leprosula]|uniref:Uncharacterized protein n=1 Tax=Rubroshorea leprosula TaxID=152421 RepID=A0AAV5KED4_9ROSI|nr:hypothetical protein SLEP1_g32748 [Rubroshorea leprosula]
MSLMQQLGRTKNVAKRSTKKYLEGPLYAWLFKQGSSEVSVRQQLNQFLKSSKRVYKWEVGQTLKKLRDHKLYHPAFKVHLRCINCLHGLILVMGLSRVL